MKSKQILSFILISASVLMSACGKDCDSEPDLNVDQEQLAADIAAIDSHLAQEGIQAEVHPSGLRYVIKRNGDGDRPSLCDKIYVTYEGKLLSNGEVFDGTQDITEFDLSGSLITGWKIGVPLIKERGNGESGRITLYIPSVFGYGEEGNPRSTPPIPPNANLEFEVLLFDVR